MSIITMTQQALSEAIYKVDNWAAANHIRVKRIKSTIIETKQNQRTRNKLDSEYRGYSVRWSYKYLGIEIDNDLTMRIENKHLKQEEKELSHLLGMAWAKK